MTRYLSILPMLSALAVAQTDPREVILEDEAICAEAYALDAVEDDQLFRVLDFEIDTFGYYCIVPWADQYAPSKIVSLIIGTGETAVKLEPLGLHGCLVVSPIIAAVPMAADDVVQLPFDPVLAGITACFQSVSVKYDPAAPLITTCFSNGLSVQFMDTYPN